MKLGDDAHAAFKTDRFENVNRENAAHQRRPGVIAGPALRACDLARGIFAFRGPCPAAGTGDSIGRFAVWNRGQSAPSELVAVLSYDEKPGIQAIQNTAPDLPPVPGLHAAISRDHEYIRHGTPSLLAGIDLLSGEVLGLVRDRHRSAEFIEFLRMTDAQYPSDARIRIVLDNHSAHISKETRALFGHSA